MSVSKMTCLAVVLAGAGAAFAQPADPADPQPDQPAPVPDPSDPADPVYPTTDPTQPTTDPTTTTVPPAPAPAPSPGIVAGDVDVDIDTDDDVDLVWYDRLGIGLTAGGGVTGFINEDMRDTSAEGGNWAVRVALGTRSPIAFEGSYIGSVQSIESLGLSDDALLLGNGVQGAVRFNATTRAELQPFVYAGVAWRRYSLQNVDINTSDIADSDDVLEIPVGLGLAYKVGGFLVDLRGEFRGTTQEDMVPALDIDDEDGVAAMHSWGVNANIGVEL